MRKLLLLALILIGTFAKVEAKDIVTSIVIDNKELEVYDDSITNVKLSLRWGTDFLRVEVENKTTERIYIEWENARINGEKVVFDDDSRVSMKNGKTDEAIIAHSKTQKDITGMNHILDSRIRPLTTKSVIKKNGFDTGTLILPIRYKDKNYDYSFEIKYTLE